MDNITLGNLTLGEYTLVTFTLGNLALSLGNHRYPSFATKIAMFILQIYPTSKYFTQTASEVSVTFCISVKQSMFGGAYKRWSPVVCRTLESTLQR